MVKTPLEKLGFPATDSKIYGFLIKQGKNKPATISKNIGLNRSLVYDSLKRLVSRGLVTELKLNKNTFYQANSIEILENIANEQHRTTIEEINRLKLSHLPINDSEMQIVKGYEGIKAVFEDVLRQEGKNREFLVAGAVDVPSVFERFIFHWTKKRIEAGIKLRIIYHKSAARFIQSTKKEPLTEIRIMKSEDLTPAVINIYGETVSTIIWSEEPFAVIIKNRIYSASFRNYFEALWTNSDKLEIRAAR